MNVAWMREAAEASTRARYLTSFRMRRLGLEVIATAPGGFHHCSTIASWGALEEAAINPFPRLIDGVNQQLGRQIAQTRAAGRPAGLQTPEPIGA